MSLRLYLIIMSITTLICWLALAYIIWMINPENTNFVGFALFYSSLFLSLLGSMALVGFIIRFVSLRRELVSRSVIAAFRQACMFAFFIVTALFLSAHNLFSWLNVILLVIGLSVLEFFILSYKKEQKYD